jgi:hypothetical protein
MPQKESPSKILLDASAYRYDDRWIAGLTSLSLQHLVDGLMFSDNSIIRLQEHTMSL